MVLHKGLSKNAMEEKATSGVFRATTVSPCLNPIFPHVKHVVHPGFVEVSQCLRATEGAAGNAAVKQPAAE